jgi:type IV secretory pathway VirB10-like protein
LAKIFVWVFALHVAFLIFFSFSLKSKNPKERRIVVKNITYAEEPIFKPQSIKTQPVASTPIKKKPDPAPKKVEPKPAPVKKKPPPPAPPKKPTAEEKPNSLALSLLQKIDQDLTQKASIKPENLPSQTLAVPSNIAKLHIEKAEAEKSTIDDIRYSDVLIQFLESTLELPEKGEVKMRLEIQSDGLLLSLEILKAESKKNAEYLKNTLPALYFPCFNEGVSEKKRKLIIRFCSQK